MTELVAEFGREHSDQCGHTTTVAGMANTPLAPLFRPNVTQLI